MTFATAALGHLYGTAGKADEARSVYEELKAKALEYLAKAHQERSGWITYLKVDPRLDPLRDDDRFVDLKRRVRLAP